MIDVLFVHPNAAARIYQNLSEDYSAIEPPIWASLLANGIRAKGYNVAILDCEAERLSSEEAAAKIIEINPRFTAYIIYGQQPSASTQNMVGATAILNKVKEVNMPMFSIAIGGHVSALPEKTLQEEQFDYVIKGEGLEGILGILKGHTGNDRLIHEEMIPQNLLGNFFSGMAWDLLPMDKYRTSNWHGWTNGGIRSPFASVYTSLGCPYSCEFCCINAPFSKRTIRYWDPEHTIQEFDKIAKMGIRNIKIADEMFVLLEDHFLKLCNLLGERQYDFNIWAYSRIDTVKERHLEALKKAGVNWLALGIESANKTIRREVTKGKFEDTDIKRIVKQIQDAGINVVGNYIFGLPKDTWSTMNETLDLATELNTEWANFYCAMAYPGSQLHKEISVSHPEWLPENNVGWIGYSQHAKETFNLPTETLTRSEVLTFRDSAFNIYFTNPTYINMIRSKFGEYAVKDIEEMNKVQLERYIHTAK